MSLELRWRQDAVEVAVLVHPRSPREEVGGVHEGALRVRVHAPPVGGEANEAVGKAVAKVLGIPARRVRVVSGHRARRKKLRIDAASRDLERAVRALASNPQKV